MPAPLTARQRFGLAQKPLEAYFPEIPGTAQLNDQVLRSNPLMVPYSVYNPNAISDAQDAGTAKGFLDTMDPNDPEAITALQRMVGRGQVKPQQANPIFAVQDRLQREQDRQNAMQFRKSQAEAKAQQPSKELQKDLSDYVRDVGDEEKRAAFKKSTKNDIQTDEDWNRAWHMIKDPRKSKLLADIQAMAASGGHVPDSFIQLHDQLTGGGQSATQMPQDASGQAGVAQPTPGAPSAAAAPKSPGNAYSVTLPNGKVAFFKNPNEAAAFRSKYGL